MERLYKFFEHLTKTGTEYGFNKFYYQSRSHVMIVLLISSKPTYSFEDICREIPPSLCGRTTIKSILNQGVSQGYFLKGTDEHDKRKQIYKVNDEIELEMKNWLKEMKNIFCS
tara:strand:- start:85 stop:423 length:339 start_codon:yes stop_codon:yes gene_type:complete